MLRKLYDKNYKLFCPCQFDKSGVYGEWFCQFVIALYYVVTCPFYDQVLLTSYGLIRTISGSSEINNVFSTQKSRPLRMYNDPSYRTLLYQHQNFYISYEDLRCPNPLFYHLAITHLFGCHWKVKGKNVGIENNAGREILI